MSMMTFRQFLSIVEIRTKIISVSTYILASLYVILRRGTIDPLRALLMFIGMLLVDMGTTGFNSYYDFRGGVDDSRYNRERAKVIVHEYVPWGWALLVSLSLFALAIPFGIALAFLSGWPVIPIGILCMAIGFFYTGGPYPISRTAFGEVFAGGALGSVLFLLIWYVHAGLPDWEVFYISLPSSFVIAAILSVNNSCDIVGDKAAGRRTLSILLGARRGGILALMEVVTAFILLVLAGFLGILWRWGVLIIAPFGILSFLEMKAMMKRGFRHETKELSMGAVSKVFVFFTAAGISVICMGILLKSL